MGCDEFVDSREKRTLGESFLPLAQKLDKLLHRRLFSGRKLRDEINEIARGHPSPARQYTPPRWREQGEA
jgi:hypothetical protein